MKKLNKQLNRFINSGFKRSMFTRDLYEILYIDTNCFIAHFDKDGFYSSRFDSNADETIKQLLSVKKPGLVAICQKLAKAMQKNLKTETIFQKITKVS